MCYGQNIGAIKRDVEREVHVEKAIDHECDSRDLKYYSTLAIISLQQLVLFRCMCIECCFHPLLKLFSLLLLLPR